MSWFSKLFGSLFGRKPQPTPQIAPQAPVAPAPTLTPVQPAPTPPRPDPAALEPVRPAAPDSAAPFGRNNYGTPFRSQAEADAWRAAVAARDANLAQAEKMTVDAVYNGPIPVSSLSDAEKQFLTYVTSNYSLPGATTQFDAWLAICSGPWIDFRRAFADGDRLTKAGYDPNSYPPNGRLRGLVDQVARGLLKPRVTR